MNSRIRRLVCALMLVVLAGLPVMATTCEAFCDRTMPAASQAADRSIHESMAGCHEESSAPASQRLTGASAHDCRAHDDGVRETEAALSRIAAQPGTVSDAPAFAAAVAHSASVFSPTGSSPHPVISPAHVSLVLRI